MGGGAPRARSTHALQPPPLVVQPVPVRAGLSYCTGWVAACLGGRASQAAPRLLARAKVSRAGKPSGEQAKSLAPAAERALHQTGDRWKLASLAIV